MVTQGYLVAAKLLGCVVQASASHSCAKGAGVSFLSDVENYMGKLRLLNVIFNVKSLAKCPYSFVVVFLCFNCFAGVKSHIKRKSNNLVFLR